MNQCPNCKSAITCGCQKRTASNGQQVCSSCLASYENKLKQKTKSITDKYFNIR